MTHNYINESFIYLMAFCFFLSIAYKPAKKLLLAHLSDYKKVINEQLDKSKSILEEAMKFHAEAEKNLAAANTTSQKIVLAAKKDAELAQKEVVEKLESYVRKRENMAKLRIEAGEKQVMESIKEEIIRRAFNEINEAMLVKIDNQSQRSFVNFGLSKIRKTLH